MSSIFYREYKDKQAAAPRKKISAERARQNVLSAAGGQVAQPKDFDWMAKNVPCQAACPAKTDIPGYLDAIAHGDFDAAYRLNLRDNVFPAVLGRVCTRPCEPACRHGWKGLGEPVAICFSKRSSADFLARRKPITLEPIFSQKTGKKVAVVGAGAAGLAAARELALLGHDVTVLEKHSKPGGLMIQGIPHFRLPREIVELEVEQIRLTGVEILCGQEIGRNVDVTDLLGKHDAVILAIGTYQPNVPDLRGKNLAGVRHGLEFLQEANDDAVGDGVTSRRSESVAGKNVIVIGGGFTAVDCARTARRLGAASVRMMYRRSESEMYITPGEVEEMRHEGIAFDTLVSPVEFVGRDGRVAGVKFKRTKITTPDENDRMRFEEIAGSEFEVPADVILLGTGQGPVENPKLQIPNSKLFKTGDFATGALSLIDAIAHGKKTARAVDELLTGKQRLADVVHIDDAEQTGRTREMDAIPRQPMPVLPADQRTLRAEVETGFGTDAAKTEASRCYLCHFKYEIDNDLCIYCDRCLKVKPMENCIVKVSSLIYDAEERIVGYNRSTGSKDYNMLYIDQSQCIRCGACKDVCPVECISLQRVSLATVKNKT